VIIVVDFYGKMPDMGNIQSIAQKHRIAVIEDSSEAIGSYIRVNKQAVFVW